MTVILDYGVGNLFSLRCSLAYIGEPSEITSDPNKVLTADRIILPGVGAFKDAMEKLIASGLAEPLKAAAAKGTPILGICLGMQLLFEKSFEYGEHQGLGFLKGEVAPIPVTGGIKIPHMGWNALCFKKDKHPLFRYLAEGDYVYFVHSFYLKAKDPEIVMATTEYGATIHASVEKGNIFACQYHPEKSSAVGLKMLENFIRLTKKA